MNHRRINDINSARRFFRAQVWVPLIVTVGLALGGVVYAGGRLAETVNNNNKRLTHVEENNVQLRESSARVDERTKGMAAAQATIQQDIKAILQALQPRR